MHELLDWANNAKKQQTLNGTVPKKQQLYQLKQFLDFKVEH